MYDILTVENYFYIKTHDSESQGQEEAGRTRRTSELFTGIYLRSEISKRSK